MDERDFWSLVIVGALVYALLALAERVTYLEHDLDRIASQPRLYGPASIHPLYQRDAERTGQQ